MFKRLHMLVLADAVDRATKDARRVPGIHTSSALASLDAPTPPTLLPRTYIIETHRSPSKPRKRLDSLRRTGNRRHECNEPIHANLSLVSDPRHHSPSNLRQTAHATRNDEKDTLFNHGPLLLAWAGRCVLTGRLRKRQGLRNNDFFHLMTTFRLGMLRPAMTLTLLNVWLCWHVHHRCLVSFSCIYRYLQPAIG